VVPAVWVAAVVAVVVVLMFDGSVSHGHGCVVGCKGTGNGGGGGYCVGECYGSGKCCYHHLVMVATWMTVAGRV
jgi:hypothetical protein